MAENKEINGFEDKDRKPAQVDHEIVSETDSPRKGNHAPIHSSEFKKSLATTRSRRTNAGNRMGNLLFEEQDDFYLNLYGGFYEEEEDGDFKSGEETDEDGEDGDDDDSQTSEAEDSDKTDSEPEEVKIEPSTRKSSRSKRNSAKIEKEEQSQPDIKFKAMDFARICSVCLSNQSNEDDEIIECDSCGVTVHESCYGVNGEDAHDKVSVHSNLSSESTEPWFCEPCKRSVHQPQCELCPNRGGIFKETDTGRWVHMVCALYTRGVTFENIYNLTEVSLFELNYSLYGSKVSF